MLIFYKKKNKGITYVEHKELLNEVIKNWGDLKTIKTIGKHTFIMDCSIQYFIELLIRKNIKPIKVITEF